MKYLPTLLNRKRLIQRRLIAAAILLCLFAFCGRQDKLAREIIVVFRYDDFSATSPKPIEKKMIELFKKNNQSFTIAAIPFVCTNMHDTSYQKLHALANDDIINLRKALEDSTIDVALHGYSHQTIRPHPKYTEFENLSFADQYFKIKSGKDYLEKQLGSPINIFVPPWNMYDLNTVKILQEMKFAALSANMENGMLAYQGLKFFPATCNNIIELKSTLEKVHSSPDSQIVIMTVLHPYDFKEVDKKQGIIDVDYLDDLLTFLKENKIYKVVSLTKALLMIKDMGVVRYNNNKRYYYLSSFLPEFLRTNIYIASEKKMNHLLIIIFVSIFILLVIGVCLGFFIIKPRRIAANIFWVFLSLAILLSLYIFHNFSSHHSRICFAIIITGIGIGFVFGKNKQRSTPHING